MSLELIFCQEKGEKLLKKSILDIDRLDVLFGVVITPEYRLGIKEEKSWIKLSEGVFFQEAD